MESSKLVAENCNTELAPSLIKVWVEKIGSAMGDWLLALICICSSAALCPEDASTPMG